MELCSKPRLDYGTKGRAIKLYANHFIVDYPKEGYFYHYDVEIALVKEEKNQKIAASADGKSSKKPAGKSSKGPVKNEGPRVSKELKRKIWNVFVKTYADELFKGIKPVFNGERNVYTSKILKIAKNEAKSAEIVIPKDADGQEIKAIIAVKPCQPLETSWKLLQECVDNRVGKMNAQDQSKTVPINVFQCMNTILREAALATGMSIAAGRSFFWRDEHCFDLGGGRESWPGFYSSVRPCQWKVTLNLDVANTAFYKKQPVLDLLKATLNMAAIPQTLNDTQRRTFEKEIRTLKVAVKHSGGLRRQRVTGVSRESAHKQTFEHAGKKTTVETYFKDAYQVKLVYVELPLLEVGTKKNFLPMEVCTLMEGQKIIRKLTDEQTSIMVKNCAQPAPKRKERVQYIRDKVVGYDQSPYTKEFGISIRSKMEEFDGRVLPKPTMAQGHATNTDPKTRNPAVQEIDVKEMDGTWDPRNVRFTVPKALDNWVVINLDEPRNDQNVGRFMEDFIATARSRGMSVGKPHYAPRPTNRFPDMVSIFRDLKSKYQKEEKKLDLIMVIMTKRGPLYPEIKKAGDIALGLSTQVVLGANIFKSVTKGAGALNQYVSNILLKVNAKLGGTNSQVVNLIKDVDFKPFTDVPTIIFGADVTHPSPGEGMHKPSIAAVVASHNRSFTQYAARVRAQGHREEMMSTLTDMVKELMQEFKRRNGQREPQRIIFFRDGVSEGQYMQVMKDELSAIQAACQALAPSGDYKPPITYVIVGKRHHTRLFAVNAAGQAGKAQNVSPGTITDRAICHFSEFDWFLCSHFGIQGTSRPAHYNVLWDDSDYKADQIQRFSYYLTYCYATCNRSVSIPAPVYYAHHVAFRARHHLEETDLSGTISSGDSGPRLDITQLNQRIKVHEDITGMYFA